MSNNKQSQSKRVNPINNSDQQTQISLNASLVKQLQSKNNILEFETKRYENDITLTKIVLLTHPSQLNNILSNYLHRLQNINNELKKSNQDIKNKYERSRDSFLLDNNTLNSRHDKLKEEEFILSNGLKSHDSQIMQLEKFINNEKQMKEITNETYLQYSQNLYAYHESQLEYLQNNFEAQSKRLNATTIKTVCLSNDYTNLLTEMQTYRTQRHCSNKLLCHKSSNDDIPNHRPGFSTRNTHKTFFETPYHNGIRDSNLSIFIFKDFEDLKGLKSPKRARRMNSSESQCRSERRDLKKVPSLNLKQIEFNKEKFRLKLGHSNSQQINNTVLNTNERLNQLSQDKLVRIEWKITEYKEKIEILKKKCQNNYDIITRFKKFKTDMTTKIISLNHTYEEQKRDNTYYLEMLNLKNGEEKYNVYNDDNEEEKEKMSSLIKSINESVDEESLNDIDFTPKTTMKYNNNYLTNLNYNHNTKS